MTDTYKNRWQIERSLSEGGQTHVFLVRDITGAYDGLGALKRLKNAKRISRFKKELEARFKLDISGIPKILDHDINGEKPFFVEEYIENGDLSKNRGVFQDDIIKTLAYFLQICEIVSEAHSQKIIHRDLKPQNILYCKSADKIYITDFGLCYVIDHESDERLTQLDEQVGSRNFIAPELQSGRIDEITPVVDIYSLGQLLYWMFADRPIYREAHRQADYYLVRSNNAVQLERVHLLLDRMVVEEPNKRYQFLKDIIRDVKQMMNLIKMNLNVVGWNVPQKCIYCGIGNYKNVGQQYTNKLGKQVGNNGPAMQRGLTIPQFTSYMLLVCEYCGNMQIFFPSGNTIIWDPK